MYYISHPSRSPWLDHANNMHRKIKILTLYHSVSLCLTPAVFSLAPRSDTQSVLCTLPKGNPSLISASPQTDTVYCRLSPADRMIYMPTPMSKWGSTPLLCTSHHIEVRVYNLGSTHGGLLLKIHGLRAFFVCLSHRCI